MSWELTFFLMAAIHGVILSLIFLSDISNLKKVFLGIYLLSFSITIFHYLNFWTRAVNLHLSITWIAIISSWIMPPALYLYMKSRVEKNTLGYHLIMPGIFTIYWLIAINIEFPGGYYQYAAPVIASVKVLSFCFYGWKILQLKNLNPASKLFLYPYAAFVIGIIAYQFMQMTGTYTLRTDYLVCATFVILTYGITYLSEFPFLKTSLSKKYATSSLSENDGLLIIEKINRKLTQDKLYKESNLNLTSLANLLGIPKYQISQALNVYNGQSFSNLVNEMRVNEAKKLLRDPEFEYLKIDAVGEMVGFKNKMSFYNHFQKMTGESPGAFKVRVRNQHK